jgi:glycerol kinase
MILAIDQGTTNTKALLVNGAGEILARGSTPTGVRYPRPGWVEQDPLEIWRCTLDAIGRCLAQVSAMPAGSTQAGGTGAGTPDITAIAISNQRETALLWERDTGEPVGPAVVWQCRRSADICARLKADGLEPLLRARTGLQVDPMFSGSKLRWLLDATPDGHARALSGGLCAGNVDAWLLWKLTGGAVHKTDVTNASRTQLLGLDELDWNDEILALFGIPRVLLPAVQPSGSHFGTTVALEVDGSELPAGIPIAAMIGDSHASLYGLGGFRPGSVKATYGTGTSLMTPTAGVVASEHGLSTTVAWGREQEGPKSEVRSRERASVVYALEGNIYATGGAVQWVGELLGLAEPGPEVERLARSVEDAGGVVFVPALVGLGAPHWAESAQGLIRGLTLGVGAPQLARAALDAIAFQVRDVFDVMQAEAGVELTTLLADGGASRNDLLMQLQADTLGCAVERSRSSEVSPLGAAFLAGLTTGVWPDEAAIAALVPPRDRFEPQADEAARAAAYGRWQDAVAVVMNEARPGR